MISLLYGRSPEQTGEHDFGLYDRAVFHTGGFYFLDELETVGQILRHPVSRHAFDVRVHGRDQICERQNDSITASKLDRVVIILKYLKIEL